MNRYIIFDGNCGFCDRTIRFIAKNDRNNLFIFVSSLSELGVKLLLKHNIKGLEKVTIILVENEIYLKSIAIRKILLKIPSCKIIGYLMFLFPKKISNYGYDFISKNRNRIIKKQCEIPSSEIQKKLYCKN